MNDNKVAKLLLSAILEKEIIELEFAPSVGENEENSLENDLLKIKGLTVYQLDFAATIIDENGNINKILIEIQKAQKAADIMRFRKYLGNQYADTNNSYIVEEERVKYRKAIPLITIYFLGFKLKNITSPVIKVKRDYIDQATREIINEKEEFIESLTHDSFVIQIPFLKGKRRTELELLLSVFDQSNISDKANRQVLEINESEFPEKYNFIVGRLLRAISEKKVRTDMDTEDRLLEQFENYEEAIEKYYKQIEEAHDRLEIAHDKLEIAQDKLEIAQDKLVETNDKLVEAKDKLEEKDRIIEELRKKLEREKQ